MDICLLTDINPTSDIIPFDDGISNIPSVSKGYRKMNPLDKDVALKYDPPGQHDHVYYLPRTGEIQITDRLLYGESDYSKLFGRKVTDAYQIDNKKGKAVRSFVYEMIIGQSLVYRCFEMTASCYRLNEGRYAFRMSPVIETCRYVYCKCGVYIENRDRTRTMITASKIPTDTYDTLNDADSGAKLSLYQSFVHDVNIPHKEAIAKAVTHVKKMYPRMGISAFTDVYRRAAEKPGISENTPKRIIRELEHRHHVPNTAVRIDKDLVVVTGERECKYLEPNEETRAYFDECHAFYFRKNVVTGKWQSDDLCEDVANNRSMMARIIDRDVAENTCMERFADYSVEERLPGRQKINLGTLLAQVSFLSAEQAAKIRSPLFHLILQNIYKGKFHDGEKSLAELFGITGAQIKFLQNIDLPDDLAGFAECMQADDFVRSYPDVKKRMFAAAFYINGKTDSWNQTRNLQREDVLAAAQTLNSLEKLSGSKKDRLLTEYGDYLLMRRSLMRYRERMHEDDPLRDEILAFGDAPINIKPSKISDYHNKIGQIVDITQCSNRISTYTAAIEERYRKEAGKREYSNGRYIIRMPEDAYDIIHEGRELQHCVGRAGYIESMAAGHCTILFLRESEHPHNPFITLEERNGSIRQCYGFRDSYNHNAEIRDFLQEYADLQGLTISAVIYLEEGGR